MSNKRARVRKHATRLFDALDDEGYEGWLCVREQEDDARIKDWSFIAAKSPHELFQLMFYLVEILYTVEEEE